MKEKIKKVSEICKVMFGYGILICLFSGGLTLFGYVAALIIGGDVAATICFVIYKKIIPVIIYASTIMVMFGLITMYLAGEQALTSNKSKSKQETKK